MRAPLVYSEVYVNYTQRHIVKTVNIMLGVVSGARGGKMDGKINNLNKKCNILIIVQRDTTQNSLFIILQVHSTCFGEYTKL